MSDNVIMSLQLMGFGLAGVFATLLLFIIMIVLLVKLFPYDAEKDKDIK